MEILMARKFGMGFFRGLNFGLGIFGGFVWSLSDFGRFWGIFLPPFDHPCHLKCRVPLTGDHLYSQSWCLKNKLNLHEGKSADLILDTPAFISRMKPLIMGR